MCFWVSLDRVKGLGYIVENAVLHIKNYIENIKLINRVRM